jgi:pyruvate/2-oxoglutarate/acetoin dehydrogenase E1 component
VSIGRSLLKTSKALVVYEDSLTAGPGAEIAAIIAEDYFDLLDGPVLRVAAKDSPVPFNWDLEDEVLPQTEDIRKAAERLLGY